MSKISKLKTPILRPKGEIDPADMAKIRQAGRATIDSIADQLGVVVENAILFEQAEEAAIVAERNRLARDLYDAVT